MRCAIQRHVSPNDIAAMIMKNGFLCKKLNAHQMSIINNISSRGDYKECDVSLLYQLLRNICGLKIRPTMGWGACSSIPTLVHTNFGDDLERIRLIRNEVYGHVNNTELSESIYNAHIVEFEGICDRMGGKHKTHLSPSNVKASTKSYRDWLHEIQTESMDPELEEQYHNKFKHLNRKEMDLEKRVRIIGKRKAYVLQVCCLFVVPD